MKKIILVFLLILALTKTTSSEQTDFTYTGEGMALCQSENKPEKNGWVTLEFVKFRQVDKNTFVFFLKDGKQIEAFFPCLINFDRK